MNVVNRFAWSCGRRKYLKTAQFIKIQNECRRNTSSALGSFDFKYSINNRFQKFFALLLLPANNINRKIKLILLLRLRIYTLIKTCNGKEKNYTGKRLMLVCIYSCAS